MFNLIMAVLAIALTALVVSGGASYMSPDWGRRRVTTELVTMSYQSFDSALSAYRASNSGAMPPSASATPASLSSNALPWPLLRPYLGARGDADSRVVSLMPVPGMEWYYAGGALCLASTNRAADPVVDPAMRQALALAARRASLAFVGRACLNRDDSAVDSDGAIALTFLAQAGQ